MMCEKVTDDKQRVSATEFFEAYSQWVQANALTGLSKRAFGTEIKRHFECKKTTGIMKYMGVKLKSLGMTETFLGQCARPEGQAAQI